ncbi:MAG: hypothetical protein ACK2UM_10305 [Anaerolineales bacterium]|jgi:hypothetical protein
MKTVLKKNVTQLLSIITFTATVIFLVACTGNGSSTPSLDEESGTDLNLDQVYDQIHDGARLFLSYQPDDNSFIGFIENTTDGTLERVQVIVLLSNGVQLGPTEPADLAPNERRDVKLSAKNIVFSGWIAESKVGESLGG